MLCSCKCDCIEKKTDRTNCTEVSLGVKSNQTWELSARGRRSLGLVDNSKRPPTTNRQLSCLVWLDAQAI